MANIDQNILKQQFLESSKNKQLADLPIRKRKDPKPEEPNYDSMSFGRAFATARASGASTFKWKGKLYGTNLDKNWRERWYGEKPKTSGTTTQKPTNSNSEESKKQVSVQKPNYSNTQSSKSTSQDSPEISRNEQYRKTHSAGLLKNISTFEDRPQDPPIKVRKSTQKSEDSTIDKIKNIVQIGINGIKRKLDLWNADSDEKVDTNFARTTPKIENPPIVTGDTLRQTSRRYSLPEIIDLSRVSLGYRNRGDYTPIRTSAGIITAFNPFTLRSQNTVQGTYMGITPDGKFKVGKLEDFAPEDRISRIFANEILKINKEGDTYKTNTARKNRHLDTPVVTIRDDNGVVRDTNSLNILVPKGDVSGQTYGNATGGRVIIKVGDEMKLVSGSLDTINNVFEEMKKRNNADSGIFYTLDNGTYGRAIRTYDEMLTEEDLRSYDNQNTGGGNFLYLLNE